MKILRFQSRAQVQKSISSSVRKLLPGQWHQSPCQLLCLREFLRLCLPSTPIRHENRNISKTELFGNIALKHILRPGPQRERRQTKGPGKRGHIVAHDVSWAAQTGKHLLRTQNVSEQNQKHFLYPGHKICVRNKCCARGQTGKHLCRQQCVLVCQGL